MTHLGSSSLPEGAEGVVLHVLSPCSLRPSCGHTALCTIRGGQPGKQMPVLTALRKAHEFINMPWLFHVLLGLLLFMIVPSRRRSPVSHPAAWSGCGAESDEAPPQAQLQGVAAGPSPMWPPMPRPAARHRLPGTGILCIYVRGGAW